MLKQKITPSFAKYDIVNSEMPMVFLDPTAKTKIYLYKTNQEFEQIFLDENDSSQRIVNFQLEREMEIWLAQNFTKQINPFQNASASKTIAMQTEIEFYSFENLEERIQETFYFFTFQPISQDRNDKTPKFLIKESIANIDKTKFRFAKLKAWQLSSTLIKNYQYWTFQRSADLRRKKIKSVKIRAPYYSFLGNIRLNGNTILNDPPQESAYSLNSVIHPFKSLEPIACNFSFKNGNLYTQFINWDCLGRAIAGLKNYYFVMEGGTNRYWTMDFSSDSFGLCVALQGAITGTGTGAPSGALYGLMEYYANHNKDATDDLKAYFWAKESWNGKVQREYYNIFKYKEATSQQANEQFFKESTPTFQFNPRWSGEDAEFVEEPFYSFSCNVMNPENFEISDIIVEELGQAKNYCWCLAGEIPFTNIGMFSKKFNGRSTWTNPDYYNWGVLPLNFMGIDKIRRIMSQVREDKDLDYIEINLDLNEPTYLNSLEMDILFADSFDVIISDENDFITNYNSPTSFYLLGQDNVRTKINFL